MLEHLFERFADIAVEAFFGLSLRAATLEQLPAGWRLISFGALGELRRISERLTVVPCNYSALPKLFAEGLLPNDIGIVQVSPPDALGECSLGVTADFAADAALHSRVLIAEINHSLPRSLGSPTIPIERFAAVFESGTALHEHPEPVPDETELAIAAHVARLVEDGDTLQMGVGRIPTAVLRALASHTDLGVHSGIITPAVDALVRLGVVTGGAKAIDRGKVVAGSALGDRAFYDRVLHDPAYEFRPTSYTHSPANLARVGNLVAINSSIAVDLRGQVSAEVKDGRYIGAVGGQGDFARAASSTGRCSIIAQRSTSGGESMIVETLPDGLISTAKSDVDYLVTEHGVADLRGKGFLERAERIASVAAPAFRDGLLESVRRIR